MQQKEGSQPLEDPNNIVRCENCRKLDEDPLGRACAHEEVEKYLMKFHVDQGWCGKNMEQRTAEDVKVEKESDENGASDELD